MYMIIQHNVIGRKENNQIRGQKCMSKKAAQRMLNSFYAKNIESDLRHGYEVIEDLEGVSRIVYLYRPTLLAREALLSIYKDEPFIYYTIEKCSFRD